MCGSSAASIPTPVSTTSIRALGVAATSTETDPPRPVNFTGIGHQVGHDLADPLRVVPDPDRRSRQVERQGDAAFRAAAALLLHGRLDGRPEIVRPKVQQDQARIELRQLQQVLGQPVEPLDLLAARLDELGARVRVRRPHLRAAAR